MVTAVVQDGAELVAVGVAAQARGTGITVVGGAVLGGTGRTGGAGPLVTAGAGAAGGGVP